MKYIVTTQFFNIDRRGNAKRVPVGTVLTQDQYNALTPQKKAKCEVYETTTDRNSYTFEEAIIAGQVYLKKGRTPESKSIIFEAIGDRHTVGSIDRVLTQFQVLDVDHPDSTEWNISSTIRKAAVELAPDRFN
jgi:hypothetical protein